MGRLLIIGALALGAYLVLLQPGGPKMALRGGGIGGYSGAAGNAIDGVRSAAGGIMK